MSTHIDITAEAVLNAVTECRNDGAKAFLRKYGFKASRDYNLIVDGVRYESKAIVAVAHKWVPGIDRALRYGELSGGINDAVAHLLRLGFEVRLPAHDPDWTWEEHVLALELYQTHPLKTPDKKSPEILGLSRELNRLGARMGVVGSEKYRNPNGVYMKLMNFRRLDPTFEAAGKVGLSNGAAGERAVWSVYANDIPALKAAAAAIRVAIDDVDVVLDVRAPDEDGYEAQEGRVELRLHRSRERSRVLVDKKKKQVLASARRLACEVCEFDFASRYGELGADFIEVHHRRPVSELKAGEKTRLADLAVVCSNCHRMLHRRRGVLSIEALKAALT